MIAAKKEAAGAATPTAGGTAVVTSHPATASVPRPIAAIYVRQSRTDEEDQYRNISPDMQEQACRKLLDGYEVRVFTDLNRSGKETSRRSSYLEMMRLVDEGAIRVVAAYELSRITRDVGDQDDFFDALTAHGVKFLSAREPIDLSTPEGEFGAVILGGTNQLYRKQVSRRVKDAMQRRREHGDPLGRLLPGLVRTEETMPNGYRKPTIEINSGDAEIIRELFAEYATGAYSFKSLAREMNRRGRHVPHSADGPPPSAHTATWTPDKLQTFLANEKYTGEYEHSGTRYKTSWPAIIDRAIWNACVRVRMHALQPPRDYRRYHTYVLTGTLRCGRCGATTRGLKHKEKARQGEWPYYVCATRWTQGRESCGQPYFRESDVDAEVLKVLQAMVVPGLAEAVDAAIKSYAGQERRSNRQARKRSIDERLKRLAELYELGDIPKAEYVSRKNDLLIERDQLDAQPAAASIALQKQRVSSVVEDWPGMTDEEKKQVVQLIFAEIRADHTAEGIKVEFKPRPTWEPYVQAVLAKQPQAKSEDTGSYNIGSPDGIRTHDLFLEREAP